MWERCIVCREKEAPVDRANGSLGFGFGAQAFAGNAFDGSVDNKRWLLLEHEGVFGRHVEAGVTSAVGGRLSWPLGRAARTTGGSFCWIVISPCMMIGLWSFPLALGQLLLCFSHLLGSIAFRSPVVLIPVRFEQIYSFIYSFIHITSSRRGRMVAVLGAFRRSLADLDLHASSAFVSSTHGTAACSYLEHVESSFPRSVECWPRKCR